MPQLLPLAAPALPLDEAGKYVAAAYIVFIVLLVAYIAIMAAKVQRIEGEVRELADHAEGRGAGAVPDAAPGGGSPPADPVASPGEG